MIFGYKSRYERFLEVEIERLRNETRVLLSALLERAVSREAALMLRTPDELDMTIKDIKSRAAARYESLHGGQTEQAKVVAGVGPPDLRHWRSARGEMESRSATEAAAEPGRMNDSVERIEAKVAAAKTARGD